MFNRILVATDGSMTANRGLKSAIDLAADQHATLYILFVVDDMAAVPAADQGGFIPAEYIEGMVESLRETGARVVGKAAQLACDRGLEARTLVVESLGRSVAGTILAQAKKHKAELIVLGTHGRRGLRRVLLGSDAENVLHEARVPVMLVRSVERRAPSKPASPRRAKGASRAIRRGEKATGKPAPQSA